MDEEKAVRGQLRSTERHRAVAGKGGLGVTPYAGIAALPTQTTAQLRLPYLLVSLSSITWALLLGGPYQMNEGLLTLSEMH